LFFKCADVICDFCGYLAQIKTSREQTIDSVPRAVLGAAWGPQRERMEAAIYFPLLLVQKFSRNYAIFYLSADLQTPAMFRPRSPLSATARRAGWQGFMYELESVQSSFARLR
jgi:type II restriction enzyme